MNKTILMRIPGATFKRSARISAKLRRTLLAALSVSMMAMAGCGGASSAPISGYNPLGEVSVSITPPVMTIGTTTTQAFTATVK